MPSTISLYKQLKRDFPEFQFETAEEFWWSASSNTVHLDPTSGNSEAYSLHELSHAILGHKGYTNDIDLIKIERDAWHYATTELAHRYNVHIHEQLIQNNLDTYREWLHSRSKCPDCGSTGMQTKNGMYRCLGCSVTWRSNEARTCSLRRYPVHTK